MSTPDLNPVRFNRPEPEISKVKPQGQAPNRRKDFGKILEDKEKENPEEEEVAVSDEKEEVPSPFELAGRKKTVKKTPDASLFGANEIRNPFNESEEGIEDETASMANLTDKVDPTLIKQANPDVMVMDHDITSVKKEDSSKAKPTASAFAQENTDLSYINPNAPLAAFRSHESPQTGTGTPQMSKAETIQKVIDQIVQAIDSIRTTDKTDTVVTLKQPPILEGAHIVITNYKHANNEFNIAFTNLTTVGKTFLDQRLHNDALTIALEQKGLTVHMITTTTLNELPQVIASESQSDSRNRERQGEGGQGRGGSKRDQEEEQG